MCKILIVDDHPIFRMGMAELLNQEDDFTVCAVAKDIAEARKALEEHEPDMAIVDITLAKIMVLIWLKKLRPALGLSLLWFFQCMMRLFGRKGQFAQVPKGIS